MTPMRIAFCGEAGSGKDSAAAFLIARGYKKLALATPLKAVTAAAIDGFLDSVTGHVAPDVIATMRELAKNKHILRTPLQRAGQGGREVDQDLWSSSLVRRGELEDEHQAQGYVVTDVRYSDEADLLRKYGFLIVRIEATPEVRRARIVARDGAVDTSHAQHISETAVRHIIHDMVIDNSDFTTERLYASLEAIVTTTTTDDVQY